MGSRCQSLSSFGINDFRLFDSVWNSLFPWWTKETPYIIFPLFPSNRAHVHIQHLYRYQHLSIVICVSIFICVSTISIIISQSYLVGMYQNAASTSTSTINRSNSISPTCICRQRWTWGAVWTRSRPARRKSDDQEYSHHNALINSPLS